MPTTKPDSDQIPDSLIAKLQTQNVKIVGLGPAKKWSWFVTKLEELGARKPEFIDSHNLRRIKTMVRQNGTQQQFWIYILPNRHSVSDVLTRAGVVPFSLGEVKRNNFHAQVIKACQERFVETKQKGDLLKCTS